MWSVTNSTDGPQGSISKSVNQNSYGAKSALSEPQGLQQASTTHHSVSDHSPHSDMQANVHNVESTQRYDVASSHGTSGSFMSTNGNGACRNIGGSNGAHSNNSDPLQVGATVESSGSHNQNMYGAQYNSVSRAKSQVNGCENNSCGNSSSPYSGWQSLSASGSSGSGWNIPDSNGVGRNCRLSQNQSSSDTLGNDSEETMTMDGDITYSGLIGATGGSEFNEEKQTNSNGYKEGSPWGTQMPRMGLLGGGENSLNTSSTNWVGSNSSTTTATSGWGGSSRQSSASSSEVSRDNTGNTVENEISYSGLVGAIGGSEYSDNKQNGSNNFRQESNRTIPPGRMGLLGGGESSMTSGPTGWGAPGTSGSAGSGWGNGTRQNNGATTEMTSNNGSGGMSPPKSHNSWAQAAGKGLNTTTQNTTVNSSQSTICSDSGSVSSVAGSASSATKPRTDEPVTDLKVKAAFSDGWGKTTINQDSPWDLPPSPPPSPPQPPSNPQKENPAPTVWRAPVNNGTEIWENNLKLNKGVATPITSTTTPPWGHTPSTNIGGHWGDDDSSSNLWTGAPSSNTAANSSNWAPEPSPCATNNNNNNSMWGNPPPPPPPEKHWGNQGSSWNESGTESGTSVWNPSMNKPRNVGNWSPVNSTPKKDIQPSGWEQPSPPTGRRPAQNYDDGTALWGNPSRQGKVSHWKDMPSAKPIINSGNAIGPAVGIPPASMGGGMQPAGPGMIRLPTGATVSNKGDMQPSVWNKPSLGRGNNWGEMPPHRDSSNIGNWGDDSHMHNQIKNISASNAPGGPFSNWGEPTSPMAAYWGAKPKGASSWADGQVDTSTWLGPSKQGGKPLTRDLICASKQFRMLLDCGYRKDDIENALRNNSMNYDDALAELQASGAPRDNGLIDVDTFTGRKIRPGTLNDDVSIPEHVLDQAFNSGGFHAPGGFQTPGNFHGIAASQPFNKQNKCPGPNNSANLLNALGGQQSSLGGPISSVFTHKLLQMQQQQVPQSFGGPNNVPQNALNNQGGRNMGQNCFPTAAQLRHLVQQIQMAVQAGHLNPQILNQPLAPQTLQHLYQLLQQIKVLTQLQQHQMYQNQHMSKPVPGGPGSSSGLQINVQITQTKQRITNLQNQIHAQQAVFLKNQQMQSSQHQSLHASQAPADIFKPNIEPVPPLQNDFRELTLKEVPLQTHHTQSRLSQWKLPPCYEKEDSSLCGSNQSSGMNASNTFGNDFSRAPGPLPSKTSSASSAMPNSGSNLHPLLGQGDSAWSSSLSRSQGDSGWPDAATLSAGVVDNPPGSNSSDNSVSTTVPSSGSNIQVSSENKEQSTTPPTTGPSTSSASHSSYNLTELVAEFEPGKPWKGTQIKNVEDDPHITPGSITRSPLSLNIKDSDLFWNSKSSPATTSNDHSAGSLTSSTWVFTPATPAAPNSSSGSNKGPGWGSFMSDASPGSDVWGSSITKARGPPPGLTSHGWDRSRNSTPNFLNFLLLRNLTPQIDGSTLKTLCMQHGPLQLFHLSLNHGIALVQYTTREEASKAQVSLNNCVLGNTTILADIPSEIEVRQYLQHMANQSAGGNISWPSQPQAGNAATSFRNNSTTYPFASSATSTNNSAKLDSTSWNGNSLTMAANSQLWSFPNSTSSLWGGSQQPIGDHHDQSTNTTLNSFLPGDLLGGEPM